MNIRLISVFLAASFCVGDAFAQAVLPGPADAGRIDPLGEERRMPAPRPRISQPDMQPETHAPKGADNISFVLDEVRIEGVTAFSPDKLKPLYKDYLGHTITLDKVWLIAEKITEYYRNEGYFLSRAYVPAQEIEDGVIIIRVVEGYVGRIDWQEKTPDSAIIHSLTHEMLAQRPAKADVLESILLRLNDLPGKRFRAVVMPEPEGNEGEVAIALVEEKQKGRGVVSVDNAGSRFLGPHQLTAFYEDSFLPMQRTLVGVSTTLPFDEMQYISLRHEVPLSSRLAADVSGSYIRAEPGSTLAANDIQSDSAELEMGFIWQPTRQWLENLSFGLHFMGRNTDSDILGLPLTSDKVRALRANMAYDNADFWNGHSFWNITFSKGVKWFGSSEKGDLDLSRGDADPDFTKLELSYTRYQPVGDEVLLIGRLASQWSSSGLFSSEEFGFGGRIFGRAYDPSELTGDQGVALSLEGRYVQGPVVFNTQLTPFVYYDIGKVWNKDVSGDFSASSIGGGVIATTYSGLSGTFTAAVPLTRKIDHPLYGMSRHAPRFMFDISYPF